MKLVDEIATDERTEEIDLASAPCRRTPVPSANPPHTPILSGSVTSRCRTNSRR